MPRSSRLAIWCIALLLSLSLYFKGRVPTGKGEDAALLRAGAGSHPGAVTVRLAGDFPRPGLYRFPDGVSAVTAIKMTLPDAPLAEASGAQAARPLLSGDVVTLKLADRETPRFSVERMGVKERMLLKIPLDPDLLGPDDWSCLPGIGPVLSERIASDRHNNGAFGSLDGLLRVPGIGPGKLAAIRRYF
ncbi:MAG: competence protein ComEA [Geobacteraceae bacterium GWC2_58_44]|nr:MAG: competence protein ComEA [Geobacteraceae bacterium GWC2_58_44]HBG06834.1 competence protein ComEA [Geobacter sp.]